jgi:hypothetical protein
VVPFLGAGASCVGRSREEVWSLRTSTFLPSGSDLSCLLADEAGFPAKEKWEKSDLAKVCSYYADMGGMGRETLRRRLRQILNRDYKPGPLHRFLAEIPAPQVIVVTNYDTLVEQALIEAGKPFDLVVYPADSRENANAILYWPHGAQEGEFQSPRKLDIDLSKTTVIYKMHGTINPQSDRWDHFVITEEDYVEFLSRMTSNGAVPSIFYEYFLERSFLFLGYSLRDWNLRLVLRNLRSQLARRGKSAPHRQESGPRSWCIQHDPSDVERTLWERRNVNIFNVDLDEFVARISEQRKMMEEGG